MWSFVSVQKKVITFYTAVVYTWNVSFQSSEFWWFFLKIILLLLDRHMYIMELRGQLSGMSPLIPNPVETNTSCSFCRAPSSRKDSLQASRWFSFPQPSSSGECSKITHVYHSIQHQAGIKLMSSNLYHKCFYLLNYLLILFLK